MLLLLGAGGVFQVALALGAPWGEFAWGGRHPGRLPAKLRAASAGSAALYGVFIWLTLERIGVSHALPPAVARVAMWVMFGIFALSLLGNLASKSRRERAVMSPVAGLLAVLALLLGIGIGIGSGAAGPAAGPAAEGQSVETPDLRGDLPEGWIYANRLDPSIEAELRYAGNDNFTGYPVEGYEADDVVILREDAARALAAAQRELAEQGLGIRVYDAFRPTRAVADFVAWSKSDEDATRAKYYPDLRKDQLFELGYIAEKSGHSLGGTVDLTLVDLATGAPLDMGGPFDFFGERSHYETSGLTPQQTANRLILHEAMLRQGFEQYPLEWWHYSYPVPKDTAPADFPVR